MPLLAFVPVALGQQFWHSSHDCRQSPHLRHWATCAPLLLLSHVSSILQVGAQVGQALQPVHGQAPLLRAEAGLCTLDGEARPGAGRGCTGISPSPADSPCSEGSAGRQSCLMQGRHAECRAAGACRTSGKSTRGRWLQRVIVPGGWALPSAQCILGFMDGQVMCMSAWAGAGTGGTCISRSAAGSLFSEGMPEDGAA